MFAKLLKHEWRATRGVVGLLCVIILMSGGMLGGVCYYLTKIEDRGDPFIVNVLCVLLFMAGMIAIAVCCAGSLFYVIWRFYKRCFTDEGYLTFTLPVTNHQILLSSITNCIFSELLTLLAVGAAVGIAGGMFLLAIAQSQEIIWADLWVRWAEVWQQLVDSFRKNMDLFTLLGFSGIVGAFSELILLMLAVTVGALIAKKHKILAAVGVYYGISLIQSFAYSMLAFSATTTQDVKLVLAMLGIVGAVLAVGGYFGMHWLTSKKLNLI